MHRGLRLFSARPFTAALAVLLGAAGLAGQARAQELKLGVTITTTGPAAALGIPQKNTLALWPETIGGLKLKVTQLDDAGDPATATTNARRLITEDKVDVLIGSSTTPPSSAVSVVAYEAGVPQFCLGPTVFQPGRDKWSVVMPQPVSLMAKALFGHMVKSNVKTVGIIGFADSWGDLWIKAFKEIAEPLGLKLIAEERYARADTSVAGQALKLVAAKPDAVLVAASGTGSALPQVALKERGFTGGIYQTHGSVSRDFIRIAGKAAEGVILASGPVMTVEQQADGVLTKAPGLAYVQAYEAKFGKDTRTQFGAHMWDALKVLERVVPVALKTAQPGTPEFREALRLALLSEKDIAASQGVFNFTETDRYGVDERARVLITVKDGNFELVK
jgi:branched-chain amino acid transport system substrate-binding protein